VAACNGAPNPSADPGGSDGYGSLPLPVVVMNGAVGLPGGQAHFLHWGVIQISLANLIVIVLMLIVFALALLLPFPHADREEHEGGPDVRR
jgi:hypothetical protein